MDQRRKLTIIDGFPQTMGMVYGTVVTSDGSTERLPYSSSETSFTLLSNPSAFSLFGEKAIQEVPTEVVRVLDERGFHVDRLGKVTWRDESPGHPRNWSVYRKCYDTALICFLEFFMTLVSNTGSSTAQLVYVEFGLSKQLALLSFTFAYLLGQAIGGLVLPPMSETFGCRTIYVVTTALFATGNLLIGAFPSIPMVVSARFATGFFSAMPATVAAGSLENMWSVRSRIWTVHLWIAGAVVGLALGPPATTYIATSSLGWRWVYMISGLISTAAALLCAAMRESRPAKILRLGIKAIERQTGYLGLFTESADESTDFKTFCHTSLLLPVRLFFTEPIVWLTSIMAASVYAVIYVFPEALPLVYTDFGFSPRQVSLVNLALAAGVPFTFLPRFYDIHISNKRVKQGRPEEPEDKIFGFLVAAPVLAAAFWVFAGTVPPLQTNIAPWISIATLVGVGFSTVEFDNVLSGYLTDSYTSYAASANAPMAFLRAILSGIFPLFAGQVFDALNTNNAVFVLAAVASFYCIVAIWFARYGKTFREKSKFATQNALSAGQKPALGSFDFDFDLV